MSRIRITVAACAAAALAAVGSAQAATPKLQAYVSGDSAFKIGLTLGGKSVKSLKPGKYTIVVKDPATIHNFRLKGPGLNKSTSIKGTGTTTWHVTLKKGKYTYDCDPHISLMHGSFSVK